VGSITWQECNSDNPNFTSTYDEAVRTIRRVLGSYDHIAHLIYSATGASVSGVSVRRWLLNRNLPVNYACTLVDLVADIDGEADLELEMMFPFLKRYFYGYLD
jgi:hypothetical protein